MNTEFLWPTEEPVIEHNAFGSGIDLLKEKFGALSQDANSVYSRICVGNSLMSLEPYRGCPLSCAYCMANNDMRSLNIPSNDNKNLASVFIRKPQKIVEPYILVDALVRHPAFIRDKTIIGFCTGSTEFFLPELKDDLWEGIQRLVKYDLHNPLWIVAKSYLSFGYENEWVKRFEWLHSHGIKVILSISDTRARKEIEPYQRDRFNDFLFLRDSPVMISHHMRPIIPDGSFTVERMNELLNGSLRLAKSVCIGGLRVDPGMAIFWNNDIIKQMKTDIGSQDKFFDNTLLEMVRNGISNQGLDVPVFQRSSEMLSYHLGIGDFNLYKYRKNLNGAFLRIQQSIIQEVEQRERQSICSLIKCVGRSIGLDDLPVTVTGEFVYIERVLHYQEERALIHAIGYSGIID